MLNNEDLLKAVQEETPNDEYEQSVSKKADNLAVSIGIASVLCMFLAELWILDRWNFGYVFLILIIRGITYLAEGVIKQKKISKILGASALAGAAAALLGYILDLVGVI